MDESRFQTGFPGELVRLDAKDIAFVPTPLPAQWEFPPSLYATLIEARSRLGELAGMTRHIDDVGLLLRPLQQREALRSSSLEGTFATPRELLLFDLDPVEPTDDANPWREVHNYARALELGAESLVDGITLVLIRQLHHLLLTGVRGKDKTPGAFRTTQVYVGSDHRFVPPPPTLLVECLERFEAYLRSSDPSIDPLVRCFVAHYQFEAIHPFLDGNGRVGRLLLALSIKQWCGLSRPWLYLSAFFDRHKDDYIDRLFAVSTHGDWTAWVRFGLEATISQASDTIRRCDRLIELRKNYRRRVEETRGNVRLFRVVDRVFRNPFARIADVSRELDVSYPTARDDLSRLASIGVLQELPAAYPRTYYAPEVYAIAFEEPETGVPDIGV